MAQPTGVDRALEGLAIETGADLFLERHAPRRRILNALDQHAAHRAAHRAGEHGQRVHQEARIDAGAEQLRAALLGAQVELTRQRRMTQPRVDQLLASRHRRHAAFEQRAKRLGALAQIRAGRDERDVDAFPIRDFVERRSDAQVRCARHQLAELAPGDAARRIDGGDRRAEASREQIALDAQSQRTETDVQDAQIHWGSELRAVGRKMSRQYRCARRTRPTRTRSAARRFTHAPSELVRQRAPLRSRSDGNVACARSRRTNARLLLAAASMG